MDFPQRRLALVHISAPVPDGRSDLLPIGVRLSEIDREAQNVILNTLQLMMLRVIIMMNNCCVTFDGSRLYSIN